MRVYFWTFMIVCAVVAVSNWSHSAEAVDSDAAMRNDLEAQHKAGLISSERLAAKLAIIGSRQSGTSRPASLPDASDSQDLIQNGTFGDYNVNTQQTGSRWIWWGGWTWAGDYTFQQAKAGKLPCASIICTGKAGQAGLFTPVLPVLKPGAHYKATVSVRAEGGAVLELRYKMDVETIGEGIQNGAKKFEPTSVASEFTIEGRAKPGAKGFRLYIYNDGPGTLYVDRVTLVEEPDQPGDKE